MKAVVYVKAAREESAKEITRKLMEACINNNLKYERIYVDSDSTRAEFNKMLCFIREEGIEKLIIESAAHFTRSSTEMIELTNSLKEAGIKSIQLADGTVLDGYFLDRKFNDEMESMFSLCQIYNPLYNTKGNRVAIYHVSLDPKRDSCIDLQMKILRSFAKKKNWEITGEYIDLSRVNSERSELEIMKNNMEQYDIILVKWAYYFSRETSSFLRFRNEMLNNDIRIYSISEGWC